MNVYPHHTIYSPSQPSQQKYLSIHQNYHLLIHLHTLRTMCIHCWAINSQPSSSLLTWILPSQVTPSIYRKLCSRWWNGRVGVHHLSHTCHTHWHSRWTPSKPEQTYPNWGLGRDMFLSSNRDHPWPLYNREGPYFVQRTNQFTLIDNQLYKLPKKKSNDEPQLVIEEQDRQQVLIYDAHMVARH